MAACFSSAGVGFTFLAPFCSALTTVYRWENCEQFNFQDRFAILITHSVASVVACCLLPFVVDPFVGFVGACCLLPFVGACCLLPSVVACCHPFVGFVEACCLRPSVVALVVACSRLLVACFLALGCWRRPCFVEACCHLLVALVCWEHSCFGESEASFVLDSNGFNVRISCDQITHLIENQFKGLQRSNDPPIRVAIQKEEEEKKKNTFLKITYQECFVLLAFVVVALGYWGQPCPTWLMRMMKSRRRKSWSLPWLIRKKEKKRKEKEKKEKEMKRKNTSTKTSFKAKAFYKHTPSMLKTRTFGLNDLPEQITAKKKKKKKTLKGQTKTGSLINQ